MFASTGERNVEKVGAFGGSRGRVVGFAAIISKRGLKERASKRRRPSTISAVRSADPGGTFRDVAVSESVPYTWREIKGVRGQGTVTIYHLD